jgi:sialate O-acetylesterase
MRIAPAALLACALVLLLPHQAAAVPFRLASYFAPFMVLQKDEPVPVWGWASPGTSVYVSLWNLATNTSEPAQATADATGLFVATLPPGPGGPDVYTLTVSTQPISERCNTYAYSCDGSAVALAGIVRGTTFLCLGQSNMQVNVGFAFNATAELAFANSVAYMVRIFQVYANAMSKDGPLDDFAGPPFIPWSPALNSTLPEFSATCWFSAKSYLLTRPESEADVPIGLVASTWVSRT